MANRSRFEALALPLRGAAYNLAFWIVRNRDDAEDVVQEAYVRAFRSFAGFRGDAIRPWLLTIVRNEAYRLLRQTQRGQAIFAPDDPVGMRENASTIQLHEIPAVEPTTEARLIEKGESERLLAALARLPDAYREVVVMRELEELSYKEIAEVVGIALGTVMSRLSRGRQMLRTALAETTRKGWPDAV